MGIQGLLPLLKSIHRSTEIRKFAGESLGVDAYGWLHRGAIPCAIDLAQGRHTRKYVDFAMHRVRMLKHFGVTPYLVFDGDFLPSKAMTEASRAHRREQSRQAGLELLKAGKPAQAHQELQKAIDVTPEMARHLIEELKKADVPYVVAPYEADAQLVYLERHGYISGIISEDSDLLVFGAKRLLTKLEPHGQCIEINRRDFCACREISLTGWSDAEFRQMAILSGCDYLAGINKMGLKTAYRLLRKHKTPEKLLRMLQFDGKYSVSENYLAAFKQAELTFIHQRVFCPKKQQLVLLTEITSELDVENMPYIGAKVEALLACAIAVGDVNPITKERIVLSEPVGRSMLRTGRQDHAAFQRREPTKPNKPIDNFFQGDKRIPLGEMDPNCFTVEPQQVARLTNNGLLPRVFPLPRPYTGDTTPTTRLPQPVRTTRRARADSLPPTQAASPTSTGQYQSRRRTAGTPSTHREKADDNRVPSIFARPQKKPRLCEDIEPRMSGNAMERSKFFPTPSAETPVSITQESNLFSDDSVEEALRQLPDADGWHSAETSRESDKIAVFEDTELPDGGRSSDTPEKDRGTAPEVVIAISPPEEATRRAHAATAAVTVIDTPVSCSSQKARPLASSQRAGGGLARFAHGLPTPASSIASSADGKSKVSCYGVANSSFSPMRTPLQRIGAQAMRRGNNPGSPGLSSLLKSTGGGFAKQRYANTKKRSSMDTLPINPAFVPLPKVDLAEVEALNVPLGSEDQILPCSDNEDQEDLPVGGVALPSLDLSRFAYG